MGDATSFAKFSYAGDITSTQAWEILQENQQAILVDVRTPAEWSEGLPELSTLEKEVLPASWRLADMSLNQNFMFEIQNHIATKETPVLFLCRSGGRSRDAAMIMAQAGYSKCYNIAGGFEGLTNQCGVDGWKASGLPWSKRS